MLLAGAAALYLALGDLGEGLLLVAGAMLAVALVVMQEARSERALKALQDLSEPSVHVLRDGREAVVPSRDLVPGDAYLIAEGERLHADGLLVEGEALSVDEAALTGESAPVLKRLARDQEAFQGEDLGKADSACLFAGTLVVQGQGVVEVSRTGANSALGQIGVSLSRLHEEPTPLQLTGRRLVGGFGALALTCCGLIVLAYGLLRGDWIAGALAGVTAAMSLVPEEFPMVLTVFMALGARRLANHRVLVRRSAVIETLGGATFLCVDKTGTLTQNRMELVRAWPWTDRGLDETVLDEPTSELLATAALACARRSKDPMDRAIEARAGRRFVKAANLERAWPLRTDRLVIVQLWRQADGSAVAAAKGAPEAVIRLCALSVDLAQQIQRQVQAYAEAGLRVLAVAGGDVLGPAPEEPEAIPFRFLGLVAFEDPLRPDAAAAVNQAREAGVRVMMITGDHPATALAIARRLGIDTEPGCLLGGEVATLPLPTLRARLQTVRVLARVTPEQKLLVVEALKENGEVVAMTGDGVNDAPALEAAHIGIAMGRRGTDVAREAADLVLLDDSFAVIVGGVRLGRRIFINLRRALVFIVAIHVPIAGLALAPVVLGMPQLLWPMHVMLLELVIDPTCALVFENEPSDRDAMRRPPRDPRDGLFRARHVAGAVVQGAIIFAATFGLYAWGLDAASEAQARALAYATLVVATLTLAITQSMSGQARLWSHHRWPIAVIATSAALILVGTLTLQPLERLFDFATPAPSHLLLAAGAGIVAGSWRRVAGRTLEAARLTRRGPAGACRATP